MAQRVVEVRASSWGRLFDCAHSWEGEQLLKLTRPGGIRPLLGTAIHAATAAFDQARIDGAPITLNDARDVFLDALHHPTEDVDYQKDRSITMQTAEEIGLRLVIRYCHEISPQFQFSAVEMSMKPVDIDVGEELTLRLKGTMDRARVAVGSAGAIIPDIKSGQRLIGDEGVILKGRSAQLGAYQIMYEENTGEQTSGSQIIALQTSKDTPVGVSKVFDAKRAMLGTAYQEGLIEHAVQFLKSGLFPPNPQSQTCSPTFCGRWDHCIYRDQ